MKQLLLLSFLFAFGSLLAQNSNPQQFTNQLAQQGIRFTENKGQVADIKGKLRPDILFTAHNSGVKLFVTGDGIYYQFSRTFEKKKNVKDKMPSKFDMPEVDSTQFYRLDMKLVGASTPSQVIKEGESSEYENFFLAHCPDGVLGVKNYNRITFKNVYPSIDWIVYSKDGIMEYDFLVHPGADVNSIKLKYDGAVNMKLGEDGSLKVSTTLGSVQEHAPLTLQNNKEIKSAFLLNNNIVGFDVNGWDGNSDLKIDPSIIWATYYGGTGSDQGQSCTTDGSGNVYLAGSTYSTTGIASGGSQNTFEGENDAFLVKFNSSGLRLWATYYGGSQTDFGTSCATDDSGNVYLAGETSSTTGIASGGFKNTIKDGNDDFLVKFNTNGYRIWATYYGGPGWDFGSFCATDNSGNVYLAGGTWSITGIASGGFQNTNSGYTDAFLVKFNSSGSRLWATYYGGNDGDNGYSCVTDNSGNVYLTGETSSTTGIASGGFQNTNSGGYHNAFLVKFNSSGSRLWGTYYGGTDQDDGYSCATDGSGNIYLAGGTNSATGIASGGFQNTYGGYNDAFLVKFNSSGARLWATYYGGTGQDYGNSCATDGLGNLYLAGPTSSTAGIASGGFQNTFGGYNDAFLVKFDSSGARLWATYYGGTDQDDGYSCATDGSGNIYLAGETYSTTGIASGGFQNTIGGYYDAFLAKISDVSGCAGDSTCTVPVNPYTDHITTSTAIIHWQTDSCAHAVGYVYRYRRPNGQHWILTWATHGNSAQLISLQYNTTYEWTVAALCSRNRVSSFSGWAPTVSFTTKHGPLLSKSANLNYDNIMVYPNPVKNILSIQSKSNTTFYLNDATGKTVITKQINGNGSMDVSGLATGTYFLKNNATNEVQKIIVAR